MLADFELFRQGAEARLYRGHYLGVLPSVAKKRFAKTYRHPQLDQQLTQERLRAEARSLARCLALGVKAPAVYLADTQEGLLVMEDLSATRGAVTAREYMEGLAGKREKLREIMVEVGRVVGALHASGLVHGDLTTSNMMISSDGDLFLIDFGLGHAEASAEDRGVDLYVLERALISAHPGAAEELFRDALVPAYRDALAASSPHGQRLASESVSKYEEIRLRGRKRTMVG